MSSVRIMLRSAACVRAWLPGWLARLLPALALAAISIVWFGSPAPPYAGERTNTTNAAAKPSGNPLATLRHEASDDVPATGSVEQRLAAGSYSYLALRLDQGGLSWLVTMGKGQPVGTRVKLRSFGHRTDFYSRRLQRRFPVLAFGFVSRLD
jgi:hypothetical protein